MIADNMSRKDRYSLLLLAGGRSSRMGKNKAELLFEGKTFTEQLVDKAKQLEISEIYISGFAKQEEDIHIVWDVYPDRGPLGGIHACMKQMRTPFCLVLPVDVPQIPLQVLEALMICHENTMVGSEEENLPLLLAHGDRQEHLIGVYPVIMADYIEDLIKEHPYAVHRMLERWGCRCCRMDIPYWQAANINTQENYKELLQRTEGGI